MCPCYSERTHYPTLEKSGVQNLAARENHGKQCKATEMKKITGDDAKKT